MSSVAIGALTFAEDILPLAKSGENATAHKYAMESPFPERDYFDSASRWFFKAVHADDIDEFRRETESDPFSYDSYEVSEYYYDILGPDVMLDVLEENPNCHLKAHNLGRLIYIRNERNLTKALEITGTRCTEAAFHGVLMQVFKDFGGNPDELSGEHVDEKAFSDIAVQLCDREDIKNDIGIASCMHTVGHAFMFLVNNDIARGLQLCEAFPQNEHRYFCASGVFMQREKTVGRKDATVSARFPCDSFDHPAACYRYKLRDVFPSQNYSDAQRLCTSLPNGPERNGCFHGLGFTYMYNVENNPRDLEAICTSDDDVDKRMCVEGAIARFRIYNEVAAAERICSVQPDPLRSWCDAVVPVENAFGIHGNIDLYYVRTTKSK